MQKTMTALIIMDGFGINPAHEGNAIYQQGTPRLDALMARYPHTKLGASGMDVGLPDGQMGNSEVGHLNIGAGRIVYQELTRITKDIQDGTFFEKAPLIHAMDTAKETGKSVHLMGLVSDGGVHSHNTHLYALLGDVQAPRRGEGLCALLSGWARRAAHQRHRTMCASFRPRWTRSAWARSPR